MPEKERILTYAFETAPTLEGKLTGGLPSVIAQELHERAYRPHDDTLVVISGDQTSSDLPQMAARIQAAQPEEIPNYDKFGVWFDQNWASLHPDGYTTPTQNPEVLAQMFQGEYTSEPGSTQRIVEHFEKYGPLTTNPDALDAFHRRFDQALSNIKPGSIVGWQDFFFDRSIIKHAPALREKGCYQTFHLHTSVPEQLDAFPDGKTLIQAMSLMDRVYVHTDEYAKRLEAQMQRLGLDVPPISRFDLGIDTRGLKAGLTAVHKNNYQDHPSFANLSPERRTLVEAMFSSQDSVPHRFLSFDRPEPNKGTMQLLQATDTYLESLDAGMDDLRENYRFFFILPDVEVASDNPYNLKHRYMKQVDAKARELAEKYPGVVFSSYNIPREFIPSLLTGVHAMTGGIQDGLCLAPQEALAINAITGKDANAVIGLGTGFAMQTIKQPGAKDLVSFTRQGNVDDIVEAMRYLVKQKNESPGALQRKTKALGEEVIFQRNDSVIVNQ